METRPPSRQHRQFLQEEPVSTAIGESHEDVAARTRCRTKQEGSATWNEEAKEQWRKERNRELKQVNNKELNKQLIKQDHKQMPRMVNQRRLEEEKTGEGSSERTGRRGSESGSMRGTLPKRVMIQTTGETLSRQGKLEGSGSRASIGGPSGPRRQMSQDRVDCSRDGPPGTRRHVSQDRADSRRATIMEVSDSKRQARSDRVDMTRTKESKQMDIRPHKSTQQNNAYRKSDPRLNERGSSISLARRATIDKSRAQREAYLSQEKIVRRETRTIRAEVFSIILHVFVVATSLMVIVPMTQVAKQWMVTRQRCPLYVYDSIQNVKYWGNPSMAPCNLIAYLPSLVLVISGILILLHIVILHLWRSSGNPPEVAFTRHYAFITLAITCFEFAIIFTVACGISDGFRQTCLVFHQVKDWVKYVPQSCKESFDDRDDAYNMVGTHTFDKIITAIVGAWLCSLTTFIIVFVNLSRSRICSFCS